MEIITTERGGKKLCLNGFMYTVKNETKVKNEITWRSVRRTSYSCKAILQITKAFEEPTLKHEHNHIADTVGEEVEKCRQKMKKTASTTNDNM